MPVTCKHGIPADQKRLDQQRRAVGQPVRAALTRAKPLQALLPPDVHDQPDATRPFEIKNLPDQTFVQRVFG